NLQKNNKPAEILQASTEKQLTKREKRQMTDSSNNSSNNFNDN
ncbi:2179_t:CDS:1, partial [Gigaspora rosea]